MLLAQKVGINLQLNNHHVHLLEMMASLLLARVVQLRIAILLQHKIRISRFRYKLDAIDFTLVTTAIRVTLEGKTPSGRQIKISGMIIGIVIH